MKKCIKYCVIAILAALLHVGAMKAAAILCTPVRGRIECCFLTQAPTATQQAVCNFYNHLPSPSICLEHVDNSQVPGSKTSLLRFYIYKMRQSARAPECDRLSYLSAHPVPDPYYYVIGLRKIII